MARTARNLGTQTLRLGMGLASLVGVGAVATSAPAASSASLTGASAASAARASGSEHSHTALTFSGALNGRLSNVSTMCNDGVGDMQVVGDLNGVQHWISIWSDGPTHPIEIYEGVGAPWQIDYLRGTDANGNVPGIGHFSTTGGAKLNATLPAFGQSGQALNVSGRIVCTAATTP
jgi:hypothetical protein